MPSSMGHSRMRSRMNKIEWIWITGTLAIAFWNLHLWLYMGLYVSSVNWNVNPLIMSVSDAFLFGWFPITALLFYLDLIG